MSGGSGGQLAALIREQKPAILDEWEEAVRHSASFSANLSRDDLRDDMPSFLDRLMAWLSTDSTDTSKAVERETTGKHATHRLQHGVELRHLVHEYRLLRQIVLRRAIDAAKSVDELRGCIPRFANAVDHAIAESVASYSAARDQGRELMLGILGHDLRNPLNTISMAAQSLLAAGTLGEAEATVASRILRAADRVKRIVADLLDVVRSRFGVAMPVRPEPLDFRQVADNVTSELRLAHPGRKIAFEANGDLRGHWDRVRVAQLVSNLVGNAIVHGDDPISVSVTGREFEVELCVSNAGPAIRKELIPTLFDPFRRAPSKCSERDCEMGMGLGLYICAEIVRAHGGAITVESDERRTTFKVVLPRRLVAPGAPS